MSTNSSPIPESQHTAGGDQAGNPGDKDPSFFQMLHDVNAQISHLTEQRLNITRRREFIQLCEARDAFGRGEISSDVLRVRMSEISQEIQKSLARSRAIAFRQVEQYEEGQAVIHTRLGEEKFAVVIGVRYVRKESPRVDIEYLDGAKAKARHQELRLRSPDDVPSDHDRQREHVGAYCRKLLEDAPFAALVQKWGQSPDTLAVAQGFAEELLRDYPDHRERQDARSIGLQIIALAERKMTSNRVFRKHVIHGFGGNIREEVYALPAGFTDEQADYAAMAPLSRNAMQFLRDAKRDLWMQWRAPHRK
ncbi:MAG: hypothetical protein PHO20_01990 [Candidatus Peribacteraceae bacterium]|nr:hypothetical protein [Candidatus Peribacteraceae bacterium]